MQRYPRNTAWHSKSHRKCATSKLTLRVSPPVVKQFLVSSRRDERPSVQRTWASLVAAVALLATVLLLVVQRPREASLGDVLATVANATSVQMRIEVGGSSREVSVASGGRLRWEESNEKYVVAREGRVWHIDEPLNQAASQPSPFHVDGQLDLVRLLLTETATDQEPRITDNGQRTNSVSKSSWRERPTWLAARSVETLNRDGREFRRYRSELSGTNPRMRLEALADASDNSLQSLQLTQERDGRDEVLSSATVLAYNLPIDERRFVVRESLTEDGRIGKVTEHQGIVTLQPVVGASELGHLGPARRWTPVCEETLLRNGDWLRTDTNGANAVAVKLVPNTQVILGPGSLVEMVSPTQMRLHSGEAEITVAEGQSFELLDANLQSRSPAAPRQELPSTTTRSNANQVADRAPGNSFRGAKGLRVEPGTHVFRVNSQREVGQLTKLDHTPTWLLGFKSAMTQESLGSLIANIDGRNVPLSVGYHRVTVDIRDQIARTVIEESFVNHSATRTEGTFFFPLPADASISGFGMWIGNELVEADIVEKQRAREIYETILRERRDPGLLEWAGGNLFKARVFPIEAHSEKRVKITYTQVLPLRGKRYRYSYALQSDLLKQHPLRQLDIDVTVSSAVPLKSIKSPTHTTRDELTRQAGRVRFTAQNHIPTRDFEVVVETEPPPSDVVLIPHRRGDDGYFVLQFMPPGNDGDWDRELLPNGEPLSLLVLADTSASMDEPQRRTQAEFLAALLSSLSPRDTFNVAGCDVNCDWAFESARAVEPDAIAKAREFVAKRRSLGWTDLGKAIESASRTGTSARREGELDSEDKKTGKSARPTTHVIYLGDGIVTTGAKTPEEFAKSLSRRVPDSSLVFHAVAIGSTYEWPVLKALGAIGGGSVRRLSGEQGPAKAARELLVELASPGLRDVKVTFEGLRTAAVYPETLPNLPLGTQQIVLGRYLPNATQRQLSGTADFQSVANLDGLEVRRTKLPARHAEVAKEESKAGNLKPETRNSNASVIVTGTLDGKPVRLTAPVQLAEDESGNSFIPRLWARQHLDHLLEQGQTAAVQNEVIAMSEEFHIITPYTSLLVLENDADRQRFGVKRRFQMRDGEKFFAQGKENANYELVQQQIQKAQLWRQGLRTQMLGQLGSYGRDVPLQPMAASNSSKGIMGDVDLFARTSLGDGMSFLGRRPGMVNLRSIRNRHVLAGQIDQDGDENGIHDSLWMDLERFAEPTQRHYLSDGLSSSNGSANHRWGYFAKPQLLGFQGRLADDSWELSVNSPVTNFGDDFGDEYQNAPAAARLFGRQVTPQIMIDGPGPGVLPTLNRQSGEYFGTRSWDASRFVNEAITEYRFDVAGGDTVLTSPGVSNNFWAYDWSRQRGTTPKYSQSIPSGLGYMRPMSFSLMDSDAIESLEVVEFVRSEFDSPHTVETNAWFTSPHLYRRGNRTQPVAPGGHALLGLFPTLPDSFKSPASVKTSQDVAQAWQSNRSKLRPKPRWWPDAAWELSESLLRSKSLMTLDGGVELNRRSESYDVRWKESTTRTEQLEVYSPGGWVIRQQGDERATVVDWCVGEGISNFKSERGVWSRATDLGRVRPANLVELVVPPLSLNDYSLGTNGNSLAEAFAGYRATLAEHGPERVLLTLQPFRDKTLEVRVVIDTRRHVIVSIEHRHRGRVNVRTRFDEFVEVAGLWWATRIETFDADDRLVALTTQVVKGLSAEEVGQRINGELVGRERALLLNDSLDSVAAAKRVLENRASETNPKRERGRALHNALKAPSVEKSAAADAVGSKSREASALASASGYDGAMCSAQLMLSAHFANSQQWDLAFEHLDAAEKLAAGKAGFRFVRDALLNISRRHEALRQRLLVEATSLAKQMPDAVRQPGDLETLANHVLNMSSSVVEASEQLEVIDLLKPVFERQEPRRQGLKAWRQLRLNALSNAGFTDEALALQELLAATYSHDLDLQRNYAQRLYNHGDHDGAYTWIAKVLVPEAKWNQDEEWSLRQSVLGWLEAEARFEEQVTYLDEWLKTNPQQGYEQLLKVLSRLERNERVQQLVTEWLNEGITAARQPGEIPVTVSIRAGTTLNHFTQGFGWTSDGLDAKWEQPLSAAFNAFLRREETALLAVRIIGLKPYRNTKSGQKAEKEIAAFIKANIDTLKSSHITNLLSWIERRQILRDLRELVRQQFRKRWEVAVEPEDRDERANDLLSFMSRYAKRVEVLAFRRELLKTAHPELHEQYAQALFNALLEEKLLDSDVEGELFGLLSQLGPHPKSVNDPVESDIDGQRLLARISGLQRLMPLMESWRYDSRIKTLMPHPEKLPQKDQNEKQAQARREAKIETYQRLSRELSNHKGEFADWLRYELRLTDLDLNRELPRLVDECWKIVGAKAQPKVTSGGQRHVEHVLWLRHLGMLSGLVVREDVDRKHASHLATWLEEKVAAQPRNVMWKSRLQQMLLALDRPQPLIKHLTAWIKQAEDLRSASVDHRWHISLAYLLAELGRLPEAIALFEQVEKANELSPNEYRVFATWYQAVDRRADYERVLLKTYQTSDENQLSHALQQGLNPWRNAGHLPSELDPNVLRAFQAIFEKSASPQNYVWQLQQYYQACHDFRLLSMLPDGVIGHTAAKAYPFVASMQGVLSEIRDEATADELLARLVEVRKRLGSARVSDPAVESDRRSPEPDDARGRPAVDASGSVRRPATTAADPGAVDLRALDFMEIQVERRAAELLNQPGPHIERALVALRRAFDREGWSRGEPRHYADMIATLGRISQKELAAEQVRQMRTLFVQATPATYDRLHIASVLAYRLWEDELAGEATSLLESALREYLAVRDGRLNQQVNSIFKTYVSCLRQQQHFVESERAVREQIRLTKLPTQRRWLELQLFEIYQQALHDNGTTSIGQGIELYRAYQSLLLATLETPDPGHRTAVLNSLMSLYRLGLVTKDFKEARDDLRKFANGRFVELLKKNTNQYQPMVSAVASAIHDVLGCREGIVFYLDRFDHEPDWLRQQNQQGWGLFARTIAEWRRECPELGDVEPRLLARVLTELRRELLAPQMPRTDLFHQNSEFFWKEKAEDFTRVAEQVAVEKVKEVETVKAVVSYLWDGLNRREAAITLLKKAHELKQLDADWRARLVWYLSRVDRCDEAIALMQELVKEFPDRLDFRPRLMELYFQTKQTTRLITELATADAVYHARGWNESAMRTLAEACLNCELFEQSVGYWKEAIAAHEQSQPNRGIGNGTLSQYYSKQAIAYAGVKEFQKAVDAAISAVVSWGPNREERKKAINALEAVMRQCTDLDVLAKHLDDEAKRTKLENPIARKALGNIFAERKQHAHAVVQLRLAIEIQSNDIEIHDALITSLDAVGDHVGAVGQLLESLKLNRRDVARFKNAGERFAALEQVTEAERAFTSIVEMLPLEAESHSLLAEVRESQNRWLDAIAHWQRAVEFRSLKPEPLLRLAAAQIHEKQRVEADATLRKLEAKVWDKRFDDVAGRTGELRKRLAP